MRYIRRQLEEQVLRAAKGFPAVVLTGPRRAGKTLLLRRLFPKASYFLLEDPDVVAQAPGRSAGVPRRRADARDPRRGAERAGGVRLRSLADRPPASARGPVAVDRIAGISADERRDGVHGGPGGGAATASAVVA